MNVLVIIPARGGSEGIARKNVRNLAGYPLIYYSIQTALKSRFQPDVVVSSDDDEILTLASKFGADTLKRDPAIADGATTLDPVIYDAYQRVSQAKGKTYDLIVTLQPTSPLLKTASLDKALRLMQTRPEVDTVISAKDDTHLTWKKDGDGFAPNYEKRVNRQYLPQVFKETGGFLMTRNTVITPQGRIGKQVELYLLSDGEDIDIDNYEQFNICEYYLKRKTLLFVVTGNHQLGLGHVYRTLILANHIVNHRIVFLVDKDSELAYAKIRESKFQAHIQQADDILDDIEALSPDIVINDRLDTEAEDIRRLKAMGLAVINFEDLGEGAALADLVINDLYPEKETFTNHYYGPQYFCARDEFLATPTATVKPQVKNVLVTFGGTDTHNLTRKVLEAITPICRERGIALNVVLGLGYQQHDSLTSFENVTIVQNIRNMSDYVAEADLIFTSAGRTVYEIACIGVPTIVMAQNERELTHFWASAENGFHALGLGQNVSVETLRETFLTLLEDTAERQRMQEKMLRQDLKSGTKQVIRLIQQTIDEVCHAHSGHL